MAGSVVMAYAAVIAVGGSACIGSVTEAAELEAFASLVVADEMEQPQWRVEPGRPNHELRRVRDELLDAEVLELPATHVVRFRSRQQFDRGYVLEALVRLPDDSDQRPTGNVTLDAGVTDVQGEDVTAYRLRLSRPNRGTHGVLIWPMIGENAPQWRLMRNQPGVRDVRWGQRMVLDRRFGPDDISPLMNERMRMELEASVDHVPPAAQVWRTLRIEVHPERVRMYHNGLLVIDDEAQLSADGHAMLRLTGHVRLASLDVRPLPADTTPYLPISLEDLRNAHGPVNTAELLSAGAQQVIAGVPFRLAEPGDTGDHVDVAASVFRYRRATGYQPAAHPRFTYPDATEIDPARLIVRVPARAYRRAWVLAAFDERPSHIPALTVRFFRPGEGWPIDTAIDVPAFKADSATGEVRRIEVTGQEGQSLSLWAVPIEIDTAALAADYREQGLFHIELTKQVQGHRAFPDPANYGSFQAGLPSGVRVYGLTLEEAPVTAFGRGKHHGNLYTYPEPPQWHVELENQHDTTYEVQVRINVTDPYGEQRKDERRVQLGGHEQRMIRFDLAQEVFGLHEVETVVRVGDWSQTRQGTFLALPPDRRRSNWRNSRWGLWNWQGTHGTNPDPDENNRLKRALGVQTGSTQPWADRRRWGVGPAPHLAAGRGVPAWTMQERVDAEQLDQFRQNIARRIDRGLQRHRDLQYFVLFPEHNISLRTTHGVPPYAFGQPWWDYTDAEAARIRAHEVMAQAAREVTREAAPNVDLIFGWASPGFFLPFFRGDHDLTQYDAFGLDQPQFERMPERQPRATEPSSLYFLHREMHEHGLEDMPLHHVESYFHSSHELALGHRGQADMTVRTAALSLALGTDRFIKCWSLHDCSNYWGSQHYGCVGLIGRRPEYNPKLAATAFATMTQLLDTEHYVQWLDVGSKSAYCLEFRGTHRRVYPAWTIRGTRPLHVTLNSPNATLEVVDEHGNARLVAMDDDQTATVTLSPTPIWLVVASPGRIDAAEVGEPSYDEAPGPHHTVLDEFNGDWRYDPEPHLRFEENHWDVVRETGQMDMQFVESDERDGRVMQVTLTDAPDDKPLVGFYGVFEPNDPIVIPGKARAVGLWGRGASAWNRVVFEVQDANGEYFQSVGTRDAWNCDDIHSWSYFNFDGWRYLEFPLPGSAPGDDYREKDSVWWGHTEDGVVALPLKLTRIIIETRTHMVYANELLPVDSLAVQLDDLVAVYDDARLMTDEPVRAQRAAWDDLRIEYDTSILPNPIAEQRELGVGMPPRIAELRQPQDRRTGNEVIIAIDAVDDAETYQVWVSAYPDGRGARQVRGQPVDGKATELLIRNLQPSIPMYFFVTYRDGDDNVSKPSESRRTVLVNEFPMQ